MRGPLYALVALKTLSLAAAPTVTVGYQGMLNTQAGLARLVLNGFEFPYTREFVYNPRALDCIINLTVHPELEEVELFNPTIAVWEYLKRPGALMWLLGTHIASRHNAIHIEPMLDDTGDDKDPDRSLRAHIIRLDQFNLGQEQDLAEHKKRVERCRAENPEADIVLYGVSRGAMTTFTAYAQEQYAGVKAVVLEGCPSSIPDVINTRYGAYVLGLYRKYIRRICAHDPEGISALDCVGKFPRGMPVLFVTSDKDKIVPSACTKGLAQKLADAGHDKVYCVVLKNSSHIGYCFDDTTDARNYQNVVHAFYKKYDVAGYNETYAQAGAELLAQSHVKARTDLV